MRMLETKIPPPVVALSFALLIWWFADYAPKTEIGFVPKTIVVMLLVIIGVIFDLSGLANFLRAKTTVNPMKPHNASALVKTGIYRITRNPMYVGLVFVLSAWCIYLDCPIALIGVAGFILYVHTFQILPEERMLIKLFGDEYREYQARVPRWLWMTR
jgi:protein-S-isoprenylcysteine O-methyltransferase Ste14